MTRLIILILFITVSCNEVVTRQSLQNNSVQESRSGFNTQNDFVQCSTEKSDTFCSKLKILDSDSKLRVGCIANGFEVISCGCGEYLCSRPVSDYPPANYESNNNPNTVNPIDDATIEIVTEAPLGDILNDSSALYTGEDFYGAIRSCSPMAGNLFCTMDFTKEDEFGLNCRKEGFDIVKCGCHDPICLK
jgi:hypothetical protein